MALTNNEKQIRHKKLEDLKKCGNEVLMNVLFLNSGINRPIEKSNEEIRNEIQSIVNLPSGWSEEDLHSAYRKLKTYVNESYDNPHLMNNDICAGHPILDPNFKITDYKISKYKAPKVVHNIKSTLELSELNTSDQIAVVAEVMRQLAKKLLTENNVPETFSNATAISLIGPQYDKPKWTWRALARNLNTQNTMENVEELIVELQKKEIDE